MKKWMWLPFVLEAVFLIYILMNILTAGGEDALSALKSAALPEVLIPPIFTAFIALRNAVKNEEDTFDCLIPGLIAVLVTAGARIGLYHAAEGTDAAVAAVLMIAELIIFGLFMVLASFAEDILKKRKR